MTKEKNKNTKYYAVSKVRKSLIHFLMGRGITSIASFSVAIIVVRELSVSDYAAYTAISGLLIVLMMLSGGGLERVIPRYIPELCQRGAGEELKAFCWKLIFLRLLFLLPILLVVGVCYLYISGWFGIPAETKIMLALFAYIIAYAISMHVTRILQALLLQKQVTRGMALEWFTKLTLILVYMFYLDLITLSDVLIIQSGTAFLSAIYMLTVLHAYLQSQINVPQVKSLDYKQVINMGWHNYLQGLTGLHAGPAISKVVSAYFFPGPATAAFGFAHAFTGTLRRYLPANLLLGLIEPVIMARYTESRDFPKTVHLVSIVLKINLFILVPITMWFYFSGEPLVMLVTDGKYADSVWIISALMVLLMMESHRLILQMIVNAIEKSQWLFYSNLWSMLVIPLIILAIYKLGLLGLVAGMLSISLCSNIYIVWHLNKCGFKYQLDAIAVLKLLLISYVCTYSSSVLFYQIAEGLLYTVATGLVSGVLYLLVTYVLKVFSVSERETLNKFIGKRYFVW